ncbi:MAG: substrate-binding domain-containing protein [Pseudomarimonas sp.]
MRTVLLLCLALTTGVAPAFAQERLRIHGSNTVGEKLAPELGRAWLQSDGYADIRRVEVAFEEVELHAKRGAAIRIVQIHAHGSSTGFKDLSSGSTDVAMSSRPSTAADAAGAVGKLDSPEQEIVLALDGLAVIVHPRNPLRQLNKSQLLAVFAGRVQDWSELGPTRGRIALHARDDKSGTWESFRTLVMGSEPLSTSALRYESTAQLAAAVAADPSAIGFVGLAGVQGVRALGISDGGAAVMPSREEVAVEDYPLSRRLYFYLPATASPLSRSFVEFCLSREGQALVEKVGFISQNIRAYAGVPRGDAPADYQVLVKGAKRLSLNFRFGAGAAFLDNKAQRDLDRLATFMQQPDQQGQSLMLLGFSDADEALPVLAVALSNERVDYVANRLAERGVDPARSRGMGGAAPVAANDSLLGKQRNRRVEVWLRQAAPGMAAASSASAASNN